MEFFDQIWNALASVWEFISNLKEHLGDWTDKTGNLIYWILFAIIFCETGLVVMPFLPGDSLLFTAGALCTDIRNDAGDIVSLAKMNIFVICTLLPLAAVVGDNLNYWIGRYLGPKVFTRQKSVFLNTDILNKTQTFYAKHGRKMVMLARFVPLVRTFAPFVAGVGKMNYGIFLGYGILGAIIWVWVCAGAGYAFGNTAWVNKHFELLVVAVVIISLLPAVLGWMSARKAAKRAEQEEAAHPPSLS